MPIFVRIEDVWGQDWVRLESLDEFEILIDDLFGSAETSVEVRVGDRDPTCGE